MRGGDKVGRALVQPRFGMSNLTIKKTYIIFLECSFDGRFNASRLVASPITKSDSFAARNSKKRKDHIFAKAGPGPVDDETIADKIKVDTKI